METIEQAKKDDPDVLVINGLISISKAMSYHGHWNRKQKNHLNMCIRHAMAATDHLEKIDIGPPAYDKWMPQAEGEK